MPNDRGRSGGAEASRSRRVQSGRRIDVVPASPPSYGALGILVVLVVLHAVSQTLVTTIIVKGAAWAASVRPIVDVLAILGLCLLAERFGYVPVLGWAVAGSVLASVVGAAVREPTLQGLSYVAAEALLVGGVPLTILIAQELKMVSRTLVTGLVIGLRFEADLLSSAVQLLMGGGSSSTEPGDLFNGLALSIVALGIAVYVLLRIFGRMHEVPLETAPASA